MRREDMLIASYEDAIQWLDEFDHTVTDEPVKKVLEILREATAVRLAEVEQELEDAEKEADAKIERLESKIEALETTLAERDSEIGQLYVDIEDLKAELVELVELVEERE